jgi:hypothetical protein
MISVDDQRPPQGFSLLRQFWRKLYPALKPRALARAEASSMPTIDLPDDELAAVAAAIRRTIETDKFPHAPRLDPLRAALAKLEPATAQSNRAPEGPAASQSRQAGAAITGGGGGWRASITVAYFA